MGDDDKRSETKSKAEQLLGDAQVRMLYCAVVIVLLFLIIMQLWHVGYYVKEKFEGAVADPGFQAGALPGSYNASGPRARFLSEPGATTQGWRSTPYNQSTGAIGVQPLPIGAFGAEGLVNNRGEPDFWEISKELDAYRRGVATEFKKEGSIDLATVPDENKTGPAVPVEEFIAAQWVSPHNQNASDRALSAAGFGY